MLEEGTDVFSEAETLFYKYHITTAVPVIDQRKELCYEVRRARTVYTEETLINFHEKLIKYEKSNYLKQEITYLKEILGEQDIVIIGTKEQFEVICGALFKNTKRIDFIENISDAYDFMYCNTKLLIDVSTPEKTPRRDIYEICNIGYGWEEFLRIAIHIIEFEYCTRFYNIIRDKSNVLQEYIEKYWGKKILVSPKGVFTSAFHKYMKERSFEVLVYNGIFREYCFQIDYQLNGKTVKFKLKDEFWIIDSIHQIISFFCLNRGLSNYRISVLNFALDGEVYMSAAETKRAEEGFDLSEGEGDEGKGFIENLLYKGKVRQLKCLNKLWNAAFFNPIRRFENDLVVFKDYESELVNIENGIRKTCYHPEMYDGTIYFLGPCLIYGAYVEDCYTIPSIIQKMINLSGRRYRVINLGNQIQTDSIRLFSALDIKKNDIFVCFFFGKVPSIEKNIPIIEMGEYFNQLRESKYQNKECFLNLAFHCGDYGNTIYAEIVYKELEKQLILAEKNFLYQNNIYEVFKENVIDLNALYNWDLYCKELECKKREFQKKINKDIKTAGSIVMNCNPFTKGHRYLVEYALKKVDYLYIFVVEEDRSFFSFTDRYEMVKKGTSDLENVMVVRSGKFIISFETFPVYFQKNERQEKEFLANEDLRVFGQYIAPMLNVHYRFVGSEPKDHVTAKYNRVMKKILPQFGIYVLEIPRKSINGEIISASTVRKYYSERNIKSMERMVPDTTLNYLTRRKYEL